MKNDKKKWLTIPSEDQERKKYKHIRETQVEHNE